MMLAILTFAAECLVLATFNAAEVKEIPDIYVQITILIFSAAYLFTLSKTKRLKNMAVPLAAGYIFRLGLLFFDIYGRNIYKLPNSGADSSRFYQEAVRTASGTIKVKIESFPNVMGKIFSTVGISQMLGQFLVMLCSVISLHMAALILDELVEDKEKQRQCMYILGLLPNFAILSVIFLRESVVTMFVSISLYCFVLWFKRKNDVYFILAFVLVFCGAVFHSGVVGVAIGYIIARMLYSGNEAKLKITPSSIILASAFLFAFIFLFNNYSEELFGKMQDVENIEDVANLSTEGGSSYAAYVGNSSNPVNMMIFTIPRVVYFLFSPFPWQWRGLADIIAFCFSSVFYLWTIVKTVKYLNTKNEKNRLLAALLFIVAICTVFIFAWGVSNTGTAARHRDKMVVLYLILYGITFRSKVKV